MGAFLATSFEGGTVYHTGSDKGPASRIGVVTSQVVSACAIRMSVDAFSLYLNVLLGFPPPHSFSVVNRLHYAHLGAICDGMLACAR